ncbi:MAG: ABC transporter substrate-binding protein [Nitrososphaerota archaeon]|jgi:iron complex transport system substrate-binding protein|nr:ABC transporter substrate-binding protein [Nitrososphaerota archaeon]
MKKTTTTFIVIIFIVALLLSASTGVYLHYFSGKSSEHTPVIAPTPTLTPILPVSPSPTNSDPVVTPTPTVKIEEVSATITVRDGAGYTVTISLPVKSIAALDGGIVEILCVIGLRDSIIARCDSCTMPPSILTVTSVGLNDYEPNVEALIALKPDIIFADSMLPYNEASYQQLKNAGIPVYIVDTTNPEPVNPSKMTKDELYNSPTPIDFVCDLMQNFTAIVGHHEQVTAYVNWIQPYNQLVKDRIYTLPSDKQAKVFLEWCNYPYQTFVTQSIYQAGGVNIAENQTIYSPLLSPEFVVEQNPAVIIEYILSPTHSVDDFVAAKNVVLSRSVLQNVDAVKNGRVYIIDWAARDGVRSIVGYLYWAKWIQPDFFVDIDPATINQEFNQKFYGTTIDGTFGYP